MFTLPSLTLSAFVSACGTVVRVASGFFGTPASAFVARNVASWWFFALVFALKLAESPLGSLVYVLWSLIRYLMWPGVRLVLRAMLAAFERHKTRKTSFEDIDCGDSFDWDMRTNASAADLSIAEAEPTGSRLTFDTIADTHPVGSCSNLEAAGSFPNFEAGEKSPTSETARQSPTREGRDRAGKSAQQVYNDEYVMV